MIHYIKYARVSSDEQRNNNSIDLQLARMTDWADRQPGFVCVGEFLEDYTGFEYERPEMDIIRELAKERRIQAVVVAKTDRFARDEAVFMTLERFFKKHEVRLFSVEEGEFTPGVVNRFLAAIQRARAEDDAETSKKRLRDARHGYMNAGTPQGQGPALYGYCKEGKKGNTQYVIVESEAQTVLLIFDLYLRRYSFTAIADELNNQGIPQPIASKGYKHRHLQRGWTKSIVRHIVHNLEMYHGVMTGYKHTSNKQQETVIINIPAILDDMTYQKARYFYDEARRTILNHERDTEVALLAGRIKCECGYSMCREKVKVRSRDKSKPFDGRYNRFYRCTSSMDKSRTADCNVKRFHVKDADPIVWDFIKRLLLDPRTAIARYKKQQREQQAHIDNAIAHIESIDELLAELNAEREQIITLFRKRLIGEEKLDADIVTIDRQSEKLGKERARWVEIVENHNVSDAQLNQLQAISNAIRDELETLDDERKLAILDRLRLRVLAARENGIVILYVSILGAKPERLEFLRASEDDSDACNHRTLTSALVFRIAIK